ncbi:MAG: RNA methyltransferase [Bacteroidaceae bacterium]|nr:RNA methyltransferase [Bacteroidaceae bacterium]
MISKARIKYVRSLYQKKFRDRDGVFIAEGPKIIAELSKSYELVERYDGADGDAASMMDAPQGALAIFRQREDDCSTRLAKDRLHLMLDDVQNPGNLGTIVRLADWFGIEDIWCSNGCADIYNPKTVQATMGAMARVRVRYGNLDEILENRPEDMDVFGTFLDGDSLYETEMSEGGIIIMGNEGHGIGHDLEKHITRRIRIPNYPEGRETSESLNVAIATGLVCGEFRRRSVTETVKGR